LTLVTFRNKKNYENYDEKEEREALNEALWNTFVKALPQSLSELDINSWNNRKLNLQFPSLTTLNISSPFMFKELSLKCPKLKKLTVDVTNIKRFEVDVRVLHQKKLQAIF